MPKWPQVKPQPYHGELFIVRLTDGSTIAAYWQDGGDPSWQAWGRVVADAEVVSWYGTRWIPCSEALPEIKGDPEAEDSRSRPVLVRLRDDAPGEAYRAYLMPDWDFDRDAMAPRWASMDDACDTSAVVEWVEIPE